MSDQRLPRQPATIRQVVDKITGLSPFLGTPNDLVWTDKWQARL